MPWQFVITGASRGLGAAVARTAVDAGHRVLGVARGPAAAGQPLSLDLADLAGLEAELGAALAELPDDLDGYALINNAATLEPVGTTYDAAAAARHIATNLTAPIVATRLFLRRFAALAVAKRVINLSSGAAVRPIDGWSLYGASKAGLDHFTRCVALEQQRAAHPADLVNVSPGVLDTEMQGRIRAASPEEFPDVERFRGFRAEGKLKPPEQAAELLLSGILRGRRFDGATVDLGQFASG